jgi:hypothetical protein
MSESQTITILRQMFKRLLNIDVDKQTLDKLAPVVDGFMDKSSFGITDKDDESQDHVLKAMLCSMLVHGWGIGMHPHNNPSNNTNGESLEVRVSKDIMIPMTDLQSIRYIQKDDEGRVKKALFEPDQNIRIRKSIDDILAEIGGSS